MPCYGELVTIVYPKNCDPCLYFKFPSSKVNYDGPNLSCSGVQTGDCLNTVLEKIDTKICSEELVAQIIQTIETNDVLKAYFCQLVSSCSPTTTTTSTTATPTTTTTTTSAPVAYSITTGGYSDSPASACIGIGESAPVTTVYGSSDPLTITAFYTDLGLTTLFTGDGLNYFYGYHLNSAPSVNYSCELSLGGSVSSQALCA